MLNLTILSTTFSFYLLLKTTTCISSFILIPDILSLPIPEIIYSHYCGDEIHDAFILQNLVAEGKDVLDNMS